MQQEKRKILSSFICVLFILLFIFPIPNAHAAEVLPTFNYKLNREEEMSIINESAINMVTLETTLAYKEPEEKSDAIFSITGGQIVIADIHSLDNDFITVKYNERICYVKSDKLMAVVGESEAINIKILPIAEEYSYPAESIIDIIPAPMHYSVEGDFLYYNYQDFIWSLCVEFDIEAYYPKLLCQFYHESSYNQNCVSKTNDYGICQINERYHDDWKKEVGHPEWDLKEDPYANMYIGVYLMGKYLHDRDGNMDIAMTDYNAGQVYYPKHGIREVYTNAVHRLETTLKELN